MSWEELYTCSTTCLCGKGKITQTTYGDDWNQRRNGPLVIECEKCANEYIAEEVTHRRPLASDGSWSEYFLISKIDAEYNGPSESKTYGASADKNRNFTGWLIENFTEDELKSVEKQLHQEPNTIQNWNAFHINIAYNTAKKKVKFTSLLNYVEKAICGYSSYVGNKVQREIIRMEEKKARDVHSEEIKKKRIPIPPLHR